MGDIKRREFIAGTAAGALAATAARAQSVLAGTGYGGADPGGGSGLVGLQDRVEALAGTITIDSSAGTGTCVVVTLPIASQHVL